MTQALCLACGDIKFGALVPCMECGADSTGNHNLDILFSDHYIAVESLERFGEAIRTIHRATPDRELEAMAFLLYVSDFHPDLFHYEPRSPRTEEARAVLDATGLEPFEVEPGYHDRCESNAESPPARKRWWQFWRYGPED